MDLIEIAIYVDKGLYQIELCGELDACSSIMLDQAMEKALSYEPQYVCVNCSKLTYISSAGLGVFIAHLQEFRDNRVTIMLYNVRPAIEQVFALIGLNKFIHLQAHSLDVNQLIKSSTIYHMSSNGDKPSSS